MRFRGKMTESPCIKQFINVVNTVARMSKTCVIRIAKNNLFFIANEGGGIAKSPMLWTQLEQGHFFNEFQMEGVTPENNEIFLELQLDKLSRTLNSLKLAQGARTLKIKLTKRHTPCLTLEAELTSGSIHDRFVVHDVPVQLIPRRQWHIYDEPAMSQFQTSILMPPLRHLRTVVDHMKSLSAHISVAANEIGTFVVSVSNDKVDIATYFRGLLTPKFVDSQERSSTSNREELHSATVDIKKFALFLQGEQLNPTKAICNVVSGRLLHLFLVNDDVTLQYYLPASSYV
ncbi:DNA damage checkpoint control protein [Halocaridina rubra]|uniref:Checkpoint protein n=1 Tax=Halocaridina rubra TaxID=373956 RepID=A0AAN8XG40_HALRR